MKEIWKDIYGYEGDYQVSNLGRVKSFKQWNGTSERILNPETVCGYFRVLLCKDKILKHFLIHRLVGLAFIPNPENKQQINHKDGCKTNNNLNNLEWSTISENQQHSYDNGLKKGLKGEKHGNSKLTEKEVLEIRKLYLTGKYTQQKLAKEYGVCPNLIYKIIKNKLWKHI